MGMSPQPKSNGRSALPITAPNARAGSLAFIAWPGVGDDVSRSPTSIDRSRRRPAVSLAQLWRRHGRRTDARDLLARAHDWFTEGFDFVGDYWLNGVNPPRHGAI